MKLAGYQTEEVLILALRDGDKQALEFIYSSYWPMIANFVRLNKGTHQEAEDLYQDGIITLYEQVVKGNFQKASSLKTYLYAICRNKWLSKLKARIHITDIREFENYLPADEAKSDAVLPDEQDIKAAIEQMGEPCRTIVLGFYFHKLSLEQLAKKLNYASDNVAKQQKFRCMERLKKQFMDAKK